MFTTMSKTQAYLRYQELKKKIDRNSEENMEMLDLTILFNDTPINNYLIEQSEVLNNAIAKEHFNEHNNTDLTLPGYNYLGPGTKIIHNLLGEIKPKSVIDQIAFEHDWDYLGAETNKDMQEADRRFKDSSLGLGGVGSAAALAIALKQRIINDDKFMSNLSSDERQALVQLKNEVYKGLYEL